MALDIEEVKHIHCQILSAPEPDESKSRSIFLRNVKIYLCLETKIQLDDMMAEITRSAKRVRSQIKSMEEDLSTVTY